MRTLTYASKHALIEPLRSKLAAHPELRTRLLTDPQTTLAEEFDLQTPGAVELRVLAATATHHYLTVPWQPVAESPRPQAESQGDFEAAVIARAVRDADFKQQLLVAPKATLEALLHFTLPADVHITVLEETPQIWYLVCPPLTDLLADELYDQELEAVAGGASSSISAIGQDAKTITTAHHQRGFHRPRHPICHS